MQSEGTLRRKIKKELDSIQMLNSNSDSNLEINEIADTNFYNCTPSISTDYLSQTVTLCSQNIPLSQKVVSSIDSKNETNELCNNLTDEVHHNDGLLQIFTETPSESTDNTSFKDDLCRWVIECNVPQTTPGHYYHFGLEEGIIRHASSYNLSEIKLMIGIDGLPIAKSSNSQLWPILAYIENITKIVFPVGIYHGYSKPKNSNVFLDDFISETKNLIANGIVLNNCTIKVSISGFICDSPAKAFILQLKGHSRFSSCTRCIQVGEYYKNRVCYPYCNFSLKRTHETYVKKIYEEHHIGDTLSRLIEIPGIDIVRMFPLDYMHLVALGVVKKLILLWLHTGPVQVRIPGRRINALSTSLLNIKSCIPSDFPRKTRVIQDFGRYKASELRFFILYIGPIVLKNIITEDSYTNFMALHVAIIILISPDYSCYLNYAKELLNYFVKSFEIIYSRQNISQNVHCLLHLTDDYEHFGPLDNCSAFPFENFMKELKSKIRKHEKPLEQLINRYKELYKLPVTLPNVSIVLPIMTKKHKNGPLVDNIKGI
ncbi:Uncharacterized protein FWK35_00025903 [Aphis craccivora]|uniref:Uncharacterized protein n=1 Tax=Aphis craccivora TaxID=307492 RepID=A0A6G0Y3R2_APHCR|nr:Uncharacterized protein FWK35_00025903 [Aphis craccivora]